MLGGFPGGNEQRLRNENGRLRHEVERLKTDTGVRKYMEEADEKVDKAEKKSRRYFDFWKSAKEQVEIVERKLKELLKENKTLRSIKKHLEDVVGKLKKENESYIQKIEKLKEKDKEKDAELKEKNHAITELTEQLHKEQDKREVAGRGNGIPTSQTPIGREKVIPHNPREKKYEKRGGVEGHTGSYLKPLNESQIHKRVPHPCVKRFCDKCQTELKISDDVIERDYTDMITVVVGIRHEFQIKICPCCGQVYHEDIPEALKYPNNYGSSMKAHLVWNMIIGNVSMNKDTRLAAEISRGMITPSDGYMAKLLRKGAETLKPFRYDLRIAAICQSMLYWDDTVIWINKNRACLRFYGNEHLAYYAAHLHKDANGLDEDGILQFLTVETTVMHDHNKINYNEKYKYTNVECIVHGQRDGYKYILIAHRTEAQEFVDFISKTIKERKELIAQDKKKFDPEKEASLFKELDRILSEWKKASEKDTNRYYQHDELIFVNRIMEYKEQYFAWMRDFSLPTSNSLSERALRIAKSKTKISGQFYSEETSDFYAVILSYLECCHRNDINEYDALERLFSGNPYTVQEIIPKEYLKNFDEVKHAVRAAEANTSGVNLEQNEEDNVQKSTVVDTSEEDRKPVNPFLNMTRQELLGLAMQKIREEMDQQDNPMDGAPVSVDTDEATSGSSCETQIPEAVIDGKIMPVGQPENTTEGVSASVDTEEVTPGSGCEMKNPEAVIDGEAMPVGQPENTMEGVPASVDTEEVTPGSGCEMKIPEAVIDGETMPVGQPENTMEGVAVSVGTDEVTSGGNCETQNPEAVIDGETMPVGQPGNTTEEVSSSVDPDEVTSGGVCETQNPEAFIDGETISVGQSENLVRNGGEIYFRPG